jgi:hypothetical protein
MMACCAVLCCAVQALQVINSVKTDPCGNIRRVNVEIPTLSVSDMRRLKATDCVSNLLPVLCADLCLFADVLASTQRSVCDLAAVPLMQQLGQALVTVAAAGLDIRTHCAPFEGNAYSAVCLPV